MVKILSKQEEQTIHQVTLEAEKHTSTDIITVITPASDAYQSSVMLYGIVLGSTIALLLWWKHILVMFPAFLAVQFGVMIVLLLPWVSPLCIRLVPRHILRHRAGQRAYHEYLMVSRRTGKQTPVVMLYVSLAERYVHILTSRSVREKIDDKAWQAVIDEFTVTMKQSGICEASVVAIHRMAEMVTPHFPEQGERHLSQTLIEMR